MLSPTLRFRPAFLLLPFAWIAGCGASTPSVTPDGDGQALTTPTYHKEVERILQQHCLDCHSPGRIAPFSLVTYRDALNAAIPMVAATRNRTMPPWGAQETAECKPRHGWRDDKRLSAEEIATLERWVKAGSPEGDPADAPPAFMPSPEGLPGMSPGLSMELQPQAPYTSTGNSDAASRPEQFTLL